MKYTVRLKRFVGLDSTPSGVGSHQRTENECTVCGTAFDTDCTTCPACESELFRTKTTTKNALFNLLFVMTMAGFAVAYNILTGQYPKAGPAA